MVDSLSNFGSVEFVNIVCASIGCLCTLLSVCFAVQKLLSWKSLPSFGSLLRYCESVHPLGTAANSPEHKPGLPQAGANLIIGAITLTCARLP